MALVVTTEQVAGSQDCKHLYVNDTTTGYGAPNYAVADVSQLVVDAILPHNSDYTDPYILTGTDAQNVMNGADSLDVTVVNLNYSDTLEVFPDGATYLRYVPYWDAVATLSVTNGSTSATASTSLSVAPYAGVGRMLIDGEYYGVTVSGTSVTLDRAYIGTTDPAIAFKAGFVSAIVLKQTCNATRCVSAEMADTYNSSCQCSEIKRQEVSYQKQALTGADDLWNRQQYIQFQLVLDQVNAWCSNNEGCGCH